MVPIPGGRFLGHRDTNVGTTNVSIPEVNMLKNSLTLVVSVPINNSNKLGFVTVNGPRETLWMRYSQ